MECSPPVSADGQVRDAITPVIHRAPPSRWLDPTRPSKSHVFGADVEAHARRITIVIQEATNDQAHLLAVVTWTSRNACSSPLQSARNSAKMVVAMVFSRHHTWQSRYLAGGYLGCQSVMINAATAIIAKQPRISPVTGINKVRDATASRAATSIHPTRREPIMCNAA